MPSDQSRIIERTKIAYSPLHKAFEKHIKTIEDQGIKDRNILNIGMQIICMVWRCRKSFQQIVLKGQKILPNLMKIL